MCKERDLKFIAFTYNEPTVFYEYMLDIAKLCKKNDIKTVVVSNGQINEKPLNEGKSVALLATFSALLLNEAINFLQQN